MMKEAWGKVKNGTIEFHNDLELPEGVEVRVLYGERPGERLPLEREPLTEEYIRQELTAASRRLFSK